MVDYHEMQPRDSGKQISLTVHSSQHTVEDTLNVAQGKGIALPLVISLSNG